MQFPQPLQQAILIKRYKRFLADVTLADGRMLTLHCPNTGSMKNCQAPNSRVWFSDSGSDKRKYPCTWQVVENPGGQLAGINTGLANGMVVEAIRCGWIPELAGYETLQTEVGYGEQKSRIDILLSEPLDPAAAKRCFVEVKNVSLAVGQGRALFPDAVTQRGHKHLEELMLMREQGNRAMLFFCVQLSDIDTVAPADAIDPVYGRLLRQAAAAGVEVLAYGVEFDLANSSVALQYKMRVEL